MNAQSTVFLGLFVIAMGMLAEKNQSPANQGVTTTLSTTQSKLPIDKNKKGFESDSNEISADLQSWFKKLKQDPVFSAIQELKISDSNGRVYLMIQSDELFESGVSDLSVSWLPFLDHLGELLSKQLKADIKMKVSIQAAVDVGHPLEQKSSDFGKSDFALSTARAEWVARYLERKYGISLSERFIVQGQGAIKQGKQLQFIFTQDE